MNVNLLELERRMRLKLEKKKATPAIQKTEKVKNIAIGFELTPSIFENFRHVIQTYIEDEELRDIYLQKMEEQIERRTKIRTGMMFYDNTHRDENIKSKWRLLNVSVVALVKKMWYSLNGKVLVALINFNKEEYLSILLNEENKGKGSPAMLIRTNIKHRNYQQHGTLVEVNIMRENIRPDIYFYKFSEKTIIKTKKSGIGNKKIVKYENEYKDGKTEYLEMTPELPSYLRVP